MACRGAVARNTQHQRGMVIVFVIDNPYDSFALGDYGLSPEEIASMEAVAAASSQPEVQGGVPSSGFTAASDSTPTNSKRSRPSTFGVWENFDRTTKKDAQGNEVPYAICKIYRNELFAKSTGETGHLLRHATRCRAKQGLVMKQMQLQYNSDGTVHSWDYDPQSDGCTSKKIRFGHGGKVELYLPHA